MKSGFRVFYIVEGNLADASFTHESLMGAMINTVLRPGVVASCARHWGRERALRVCDRDGIPVFRTWNTLETKHLIQDLIKKLEHEVLPSGDTLATNKRKKDSTTENIHIRMLSCIPRISENIARAVLAHFGNLRELQAALANFSVADFPKVLISPGTYLGKARVSKMAEVLTPPTADM